VSSMTEHLRENLRYLFAAIVESSDDAIISKDLNGIITSWNPAATRLFGYSAEEMIGQPVLKLFPEELKYQEAGILASLRSGKGVRQDETIRVHKNGTRLLVSLSTSPIFDGEHNVIGGSKILRDISSHKAAELARMRLAAIVESSDDAIVAKDLNGIVMSWNKAAERLFGYTEKEMIGRSITTIIPPELQYQEPEILRKIRSGERIEHFETERVSKSGERISVSLTISPVKDTHGRVIGASKIARNISERRAAEEARLRLAAIVESSDDAIISKDLNGIITSWNKAAERLFGYTADEIVGRSILTIIPPELHDEEPGILRRLAAGERIEHHETERISKSGNRILVSLTISPIRNDKGRVVGASKIARDITQRKQIEMALIQSEKLAATGRMAATIAHEINNPLEAVVNLIFLARNQASLDDNVRNYLLTAEKEIERVSLIARQTLGFYRETTVPAPVVIHDVIRDVIAVYQSKFRSHGIRVQTDMRAIRSLTVRKGELTQIISNLISNSIDAMPQGGTLFLSVREVCRDKGDGIEVVVKDQGTGIPKEVLPRLFEPFFTTKRNVGTGLGLWIVRQFLENHNGEIFVESHSERVDRGTTFRIFLPFANQFSAGNNTVVDVNEKAGERAC